MNYKYRLKKRWYGFLQKYRLKSQLRNVRKLFIFLFVVWVLGSLLTIVSQWLFDHGAHHSVYDYVRYFWVVIIELVSGFDVPDDINLHFISQLISIMMLIMGIVVVGLFTGQIISMFVHVLQRSEYFLEKPHDFQFERPILICGNNAKLYNIIRNLRKNPYAKNREIVIIDSEAHLIRNDSDFQHQDIWYVSGNPADRKVLQQSIGVHDCRVIILAEDQFRLRNSNAGTINTALAVEAFDENIHTVLEIINDQNIECYKNTRINDWINVSEFSLKLISQAALQPGLAKLYSDLLGDETPANSENQIYFTSLPLNQQFIGKNFSEIRRQIASQFVKVDLTVIGFAKYLTNEEKARLNLTLRNSNYFIQINPVRRRASESREQAFRWQNAKIFYYQDTVLTENDKLIYLAPEIIDFN